MKPKIERKEGLLITPDGKFKWVKKWFIRFWYRLGK